VVLVAPIASAVVALTTIAGCDALGDPRQRRSASASASARAPGSARDGPVRESAAVHAQRVLAALPAPPDDDLTVETTPLEGSPGALARFHAALERAARGEGIARIAAYGGSHTASDLYTGVIRTRLQRELGDAGHGFVLPVPPVTGYWQEGVRIDDGEGWAFLEPHHKRVGVEHYGLAGIAFESEEPAWASLFTDRTTASRIELFFLRQPRGGRLDLEIDGHAHEVDTAAERIEPAISIFAVPEGRHRIAIRTHGGGPTRIFGVVLEREVDGGVIVDQLGLAGAKARHQLLWDEETWAALARTRPPDLTMVSYGNNELDDHHLPIAIYEVHFDAMLARLQRHFPESACLVLGPSDRRYPGPDGTWKTPSLLPILIAMQRRVALAHGCAYFDVLGWQGGAGAVERWLAAEPPLERDDRMHFVEAGYRRLGATLLRRILQDLEDRAE
jgi:hypothetical protein